MALNHTARRAGGFSLVELLIVLAIIMIIAAIGIPSLLSGRQAAFEASAGSFLRLLGTRQVSYHTSNEEYADEFAQLDLANLGKTGAGSCKGDSGKGKWKGKSKGKCSVLVHNGYIFTLDANDDDEWICRAEPVLDRNNNRYFYVDESGIIRFKNGKIANDDSQPL